MDNALASFIGHTLRHGGYETRTATESTEISRIIAEWQPDLAFLDLDLHGDVIDVFAAGESDRVPLIAFTRTHSTATKIEAFTRGADDLIAIPFVLGEVLARPYALIRRIHRVTVPFVPRIRFDSLEVDVAQQRMSVEGGPELSLTPIEQTLLYLLAASAGTTVSREELISTIWDGTLEIESNVVDRHIRDLRVKLGDDWRTPKFIETAPGGYRFRARR